MKQQTDERIKIDNNDFNKNKIVNKTTIIDNNSIENIFFNDDEIINNLRKLANLIYCSIEDINTNLMHNSEVESRMGTETFQDVMNFYITSHAMSFLKNICLGFENSLGTILNMRCILEGKALIQFFKKGSFNNKNIELFKIQYKIIEYRQYREFFDMTNIIFKDNLVKDFENAKSIFLENIPTDINLNKILKTQFPCLLDENFSFEKMVSENLTKDELFMYKTCSQFIHPNDNKTLYTLDIKNYYIYTMNYICEYLDLENLKVKETFNERYNYYTNSMINNQIKDIVEQQIEELNKVVDIFNKCYGDNYVSNSFSLWIRLFRDIMTDYLFGLTEQIKIKWKTILENVAIFDYIYDIGLDHEFIKNRYLQMILHTKKQLLNNNGEDVDYKMIYKKYKDMYPNGVDFEHFKKYFNSTVGFLINENGLCDDNKNNINLTYLVNQFDKNFEISKLETNISASKIMKLNYVESQILSHSNGYMYYSNTGAWKDCDSVVFSFDYSILYNLKKVFTCYKIHAIIENTKEFKSIINCTRNAYKRFKLLSIKKENLIRSSEKINRC